MKIHVHVRMKEKLQSSLKEVVDIWTPPSRGHFVTEQHNEHELLRCATRTAEDCPSGRFRVPR